MKPSPQRGTKQTTPRALVVCCLLFALVAAPMLNGNSRTAVGSRHASQHARAASFVRTQRSRPNTRTRNEFSEEAIPANAACHVSTPGKSSGNGNTSANFVADDDSIDDVSVDIAASSSAPAYDLSSNDAMITPVNGLHEIIYTTKIWSPAMFLGIYQSGAAPPSRGTNENCQNTWLGGIGGGTAVALRIIGGELKQDAPECIGMPEIGSAGSVNVLRADEARPEARQNFQNASAISVCMSESAISKQRAIFTASSPAIIIFV